MAASIPRIQAVLNFFVNKNLVCYSHFHVFELYIDLLLWHKTPRQFISQYDSNYS
jgi:hypothetical protein